LPAAGIFFAAVALTLPVMLPTLVVQIDLSLRQ